MDMNPAIYYAPDGYVLTGPKLMGRQSAGNGFLRAAVAGRTDDALWAYTPTQASAESFAQLVKRMDPQARPQWCPAHRLDMLGRIGLLYLPGPGLEDATQLRLRAGPAAYSVCGVTHTTASHGAMDSIAKLLMAPVMPWDALVCTSQAVLQTVRTLLDQQASYLEWRWGKRKTEWTLPQLPVIPLGVHTADFVFTDQERRMAREALGIAPEAVVSVFVGRLSFHAKAHPHAMFIGLQQAALRTGQPMVLLQSGWYANEAIEAAFTTGAQWACPDVRCITTDGRVPAQVRQSWAAADIFISLSDNVQETFGLTPVEAMAAGLPVVVTDWNGYKDTVRDGVDGFRIPTFMPGVAHGRSFSLAYESGADSYDRYCGLNAQTVSVDMAALSQRLCDLASDPALRKRMGEAGQARATSVFDWAVVYRQYQHLWQELGRLRAQALNSPAWQTRLQTSPRESAAWSNPMRAFGHYPTHTLDANTRVKARAHAAGLDYSVWSAHGLYRSTAPGLLNLSQAQDMLAILQAEVPLGQVATQLGWSLTATEMAAAVLAKMGLVSLVPA
jgi:hypothetical protein